MIVGPLELRSPSWLLLAPALWMMAWWLAKGSLAGLGAVTRRVALALRVFVIAGLVLAIADPFWRRKSDAVAVSMVLDVSQSVPRESGESAKEAFLGAIASAAQADRVGVVSIAKEALVQSLPSERVRTIEVGEAGNLEATDLAAGIRLAMASAPEDAALRIVLVSDGNETTGSVLAAARNAKAAGIPIDVYDIGYSYDSEVIMDDLVAPATARRGETVNVRFLLTATAPTIGRLNLTLNDLPVDLDADSPGLGATIELIEGANTLSIPVTLTTTGPQRFEAFFEPIVAGDDAIPQNNSQSAVTFVAEKGRVLAYVGDGADPAAEPIIRALDQADIAVNRRPSSQGHASLLELGAYDAVILIDAPAWDFSQQQQEELRAYAHDLGGGLLMVGGPNSFGAGGWIGSPVADAMPVRMDPPQKRVMPRGALVLLMHSTEMPDGNAAGRRVAHAAVNALSRLDLVGIVEYQWQAGGYGWTLPLGPVGDMTAADRAINNLSFGDMPDFVSPFMLTLKGLMNVQAGQKHVIVISDGDPAGPGLEVVRQFVNAGITVSTVAVFPHGNNMNSPDMLKMRAIAQDTGGQFYAVPFQYSTNQLPQIFIKEAQTVKRSLIWEGEPFTPSLVNVAAEAMRGINGPPPISGYIVTADREGLSLVSMRSSQDDPILAQWQYGLGRAVAFTSDAAPRWSPAWPAWENAKAFWAQHVRWAMRPTGSSNLTVYTERQDDDTAVIVEALTATGERMNFARFQGRLVMPDGGSEALDLRQTGPGRYEGRFRAALPGAYLVNLRYDAPQPDGGALERGSAQVAVTQSFAEEHRSLRDNMPLLRQIAQTTGGRVLSDQDVIDGKTLFSRTGLTMPVRSTPIWLVISLGSLSLFLVDVGVRRVRIDLRALVRVLGSAMAKHRISGGEQLEAMKTARARTKEKLARRGVGADIPMGGLANRADTAAAKFEADLSAPRPVMPDAAGERVEKRGAPSDDPSARADEEQSMSRLLRAKRRARDEMDEDGSDET